MRHASLVDKVWELRVVVVTVMVVEVTLMVMFIVVVLLLMVGMVIDVVMICGETFGC